MFPRRLPANQTRSKLPPPRLHRAASEIPVRGILRTTNQFFHHLRVFYNYTTLGSISRYAEVTDHFTAVTTLILSQNSRCLS